MGIGLAGGGGAGAAADFLEQLLLERAKQQMFEEQQRQARADEAMRAQQLQQQGDQFGQRLGFDRETLGQRQAEFAEEAPERGARTKFIGAQTVDLEGKPMRETQAHERDKEMLGLRGTQEHGFIKARSSEELRQIAAQGSISKAVAGMRAANEPVYRVNTVDDEGNPIIRGVPRSQMAGAEFQAPPTAEQRNKIAAVGRAGPVFQRVSELSEIINTKPGIEAKVLGSYRELKALANLDDDVAEYVSVIEGFTPLIARAAGHNGVLTELDVERTMRLLPAPGNSQSLRDRKIANLDRILGGGAESGDRPTSGSGEPAPKLGDLKTFPSGRTGRWDGKGWVLVP